MAQAKPVQQQRVSLRHLISSVYHMVHTAVSGTDAMLTDVFEIGTTGTGIGVSMAHAYRDEIQAEQEAEAKRLAEELAQS